MKRPSNRKTKPSVAASATDIFCGAGGLTRGLLDAGIPVVAGYDIDEACRYAYEHNNVPAEFKKQSVTEITGADLAAWYDKEIAAGIPRIEAMTPEQLATPLNFYGMFNMPAAMYLQFFNNHMIHHRGQLTTYLRAMGGKCPSIYGGSADEPMGA